MQRPRTPADDTLDYSITITLIATIITAVIAPQSIITTTTIVLTGFIVAFTITPHVIAHWLNIPVDTLTTPPKQ